MKTIGILILLVMVALSIASYVPATIPVAASPAVPVAASAVPATTLVPLPPVSHQFVTRNINRFYVPTTTTSWPTVATYPGTYYKYGGNGVYPTYTYPYTYPYGYGYYPYSNYGYSYKSVW